MLERGIHRKCKADRVSMRELRRGGKPISVLLGSENTPRALWDRQCQTSSTGRCLVPFLVKYKSSQAFLLRALRLLENIRISFVPF